MTCIHVLQLCEPVVHPVIGFNSLFTFTYLPLLLYIHDIYVLRITYYYYHRTIF